VLLTVLGCSGSAPGPDAPASGYLIEADGELLVMDLGNGTLARLQLDCDPLLVDALLFSHLHPDHCADFGALTVMRRYHESPPRDSTAFPLPVYAPSGAPERFAGLCAADEAERLGTDLSDVYRFHTLDAEPVTISGYTVTSAEVDHPCEAYGFRIERAGRSLCYSGDSAPCDALTTLAQGADTLLAEASWTDDPSRPPNLHMSGRQAGELAAKAGVNRLVLTHLQPWTDRDAVLAEARVTFDGEVTLAAPGATYDI
jgi:ribonuclease BN (tRNA processing enzyme)